MLVHAWPCRVVRRLVPLPAGVYVCVFYWRSAIRVVDARPVYRERCQQVAKLLCLFYFEEFAVLRCCAMRSRACLLLCIRDIPYYY